MNKLLLALTITAVVAGAAMSTANAQGATPASKREAAAQWSRDGLQPARVSGLDLVYIRPGADLSGYRKVMVHPVPVTFRPAWQQRVSRPGSTRILERDLDRIRGELGSVVGEQVARELARSGYMIVDQAGADVLEVDVRVSDLYLNAPDFPEAGIRHSYTSSFGELTIIGELRDGATGQTLMQVLDRTRGRDLGILQLTTRVENANEVAIAANAWARSVRRELAAR